MTDQHRAMCAELVDKLHEHTSMWEGHEIDLVTRARALLGQQEPEGPTDDELLDIARSTDLVYYMGKGSGFSSPYIEGTDIAAEVLAFARAALALWGHPTPQPVPVSERPWERTGWCDEQGRCWWFDSGSWILLSFSQGFSWGRISHCLPHYALPTPEARP